MIVIPMVGRSSRFFQAGYAVPKYQLSLNGRSVFWHSVDSFRRYFDDEKFVFLCRRDFNAHDFIQADLSHLGVKQFRIQSFEAETRGQADTVYQGLRGVDPEEPLYIFNIDTFRPGFEKSLVSCDGYLEVFVGEGDHWSFVQPGPSSSVVATTEKVRISNLCSDGLYYFKRKGDFDAAFEDASCRQELVQGEFYVAPLYNYLIRSGKMIRYVVVSPDSIVFCGTPSEYEALAGRGGNT
jgi:hypothetical protein